MIQHPTPFAERLRSGELMLGTVLTFSAVEVTELMAQCGFDWLFIDTEHGSFGPHEVLKMLQAAGECPCLVRLPGHDEIWLKKSLDIGAAGIIVPQVNTGDQARRIINACKFPPDGQRGLGLSRASTYGVNLGEYITRANNHTAIVLQIENREGVDNIEQIVEVPGIDAILVGPLDLSASYNKPGQTSDPEVIAAIERVTQVCHNSGVRLGTAVATTTDAQRFIALGYTLVSTGADCLYLASGAREVLSTLR